MGKFWVISITNTGLQKFGCLESGEMSQQVTRFALQTCVKFDPKYMVGGENGLRKMKNKMIHSKRK